MKAKKKMSMYMGGGKMKEMYMKGGKMPEYMYGGKVYKDGGSMMEALLKDPKQRAAAKKMLGSMEKGGMMKYEKGGIMNATGETGKNKNKEELVLGMTPKERRIFAKLSPYQKKQLLKRREEKAQREDVRETGTSNVYGIHSKVGKTGFPVIGARDSETGQRQEFKEGFVRVGYESSDALKNKKLGILPKDIGKGSSK
tara:strand:- start:18713 stop:19306 length:594 start_codon:yes stop_codon:yes gene_type:complete